MHISQYPPPDMGNLCPVARIFACTQRSSVLFRRQSGDSRTKNTQQLSVSPIDGSTQISTGQFHLSCCYLPDGTTTPTERSSPNSKPVTHFTARKV
ncbi:hypothetical protein AVEN_186345-1 [Araneus ventricosus]|uniref:Uncharacterized protein n=1 Tax=Araneus ventricosus TaxID=182803 RepID=A0A4Y2TY31_ARAVE|nr:hypothetical protein AVEN_186345-1 [Araneus ventricosus]